jgi:hypothetical protein
MGYGRVVKDVHFKQLKYFPLTKDFELFLVRKLSYLFIAGETAHVTFVPEIMYVIGNLRSAYTTMYGIHNKS